VEFLRPATWAEALAAKAEHPAAVPIAGGTDVMVELNFDRRRPEARSATVALHPTASEELVTLHNKISG